MERKPLSPVVQQVPGLTLVGPARRIVSSPEPIASQLELREAEATAEPPCLNVMVSLWGGGLEGN